MRKSILSLATAILVTATLPALLPAQVDKPAASRPAKKAPKKQKYDKVAVLGVATRAPTKQESIKYALDFQVRYNGQLVESVAKGSNAAKAGIRKGDIIIQIDKVKIFSQDDIRDIVMVRKPEQEITVILKRRKSKKQKTLRWKLGGKKISKRKTPRLEWDYAGLPYLKAALAQAKKEQKRVLIGLSGAET